MTRCSHIQTMITEYVSDELAPLERAIVEDHLAECAACREELQLARDLGAAVADLPRVACPDRVTGAINAAIDRDERTSPRRSAWWRVGGASGLVAAAVLLVVLMRGEPAPVPTDVAMPPADTTEVAEPALESARQDFLWTLAYTASVFDRSEKRSIVNVLRELRERTPDSHAAGFPGGQG
jgi:anti-sigma factor RsiW